MNKPTLFAAVALLLTGAAAAGGNDKSKDMDVPTFEALDKDASGTISRQEARAYPSLERIFANVDGDRNGELLVSEYRKAVRELES